jgi:glycosyltransferase involved in cell wall biosynthesis
MVEREGVAQSKIRVVLNGIDFDRVREPEPSARDAIRREWAPAGEALLVCVGRLHPEKGYDVLFEAMPQVSRDLTGRVRLLVLGEGSFEAEYRRHISRLGLDQIVHFLGFKRDAPAYIAAADVFVLASVAEAFGLVLAEALYLGTPVVTTRVGGIPEIVDDGRDGVLVPPSDAGALASALTSLARSPELRRSLSGAGRAKVLERFRFDRMVAQYESVYRELLP